MIKILRNWCEGLVIAVIISIIIEMLIPDGNNKKYIKVVIGIYIIFSTINPILDLINYDINFENYINIDTVQSSSSVKDYADSIRKVYINGLENDIKLEITNLGYIVNNINILFDKDYTNVEKIELEILGKNEKINNIEPVIIGKEELKDESYEDIEKILIEKYAIKKENIIIK